MQRAPGPAADIVETAADDDGLAKPPLLVLDRVRAFLDEHGLGSGGIRARRIGEGGGSNFTFLLERGSESFVLRRPPRPPLPPSAHDVVREARLQLALRDAGFARLPTIVAVCEDESLLGVPFYVMTYLDGLVPTDERAARRSKTEPARRALGLDLVDSLVEIHAADVGDARLAAFARPGSYNERQVRRFAQLWEINKTREIPAVEEVGAGCGERARSAPVDRRARGLPARQHDGRADDPPARSSPSSTGRWARSAIRAPTSAICSRRTASRAAPPNPLGTSPVTARSQAFPSRSELVERYVARSGRDVEQLPWFEALALWKAAVFCEAIYGRYVRGELAAEDERAARFEEGVPYLAEAAASAISRA